MNTLDRGLWLRSRAVFDGERLREGIAVRIGKGVVEAIAPVASLPEAAACIDLDGIISPGFVDLQVNGGGGVLLNSNPSCAGMKEIAAAHRALGTVAIMPTVITDAPDVLDHAAQAAIDARSNHGIVGLHVEGPHISVAKRGTHDSRYIRPLDEHTISVVKNLRVAGVAVMITLAPEAATPKQIKALAGMGAVVSLGHSAASAECVTKALSAGAQAFTHLFNAMSQMSAREPGMVGAAICSNAYAGIIADGVHVREEMVALAIRARPVNDRMFLVSDAMPTVGGLDRFVLYGKEISVRDGKLVNAEGALAGAHTTMAEGVKRLHRRCGVSAEQALRMGITVPAMLMNMPHLRQIENRQIDDLIVLDSGTLTYRGTLKDLCGEYF